MLKIVKKASDETKLLNTELNILLVGASGVGKSSTINALFDIAKISCNDICKIGHNVMPETKNSTSYEMGKIKIWDTPGFGDTNEQDKKYKEEIVNVLKLKDGNSHPLIDIVMVIIDGSNKDINTPLNIINNIILPHIHPDDINRILIGINKIDLIKTGRYWDNINNKPQSEIHGYLEKLQNDIQSRIFEFSNVKVSPILYSAGDNKNNIKPYNMLYLMKFILENTKSKKRKIAVVAMNNKKQNWENNSDQEKVEKSLKEILRYIFRTGVLGAISSFFGGLLILE